MAYIKDSAIACLEKMFCELRENSDKISRIKAVFLKNYVIPTLEASKTADVEEVKHGEWVKEGCGLLVCNKCKFEYAHAGMPDEGLNYCPNCGAKMDGGEAE
jgi:hypothetical protein